MILARRLDLAPRIASRSRADVLLAETGRRAVQGFIAARGVAALNNERLLDVTREVATRAAAINVPIVVLKGMALHIAGLTTIDGRSASDVDVLVAEESLASLAEGLRGSGFQADHGGPDCEHQLPSLHRGPGETVDLHRFLPGVCLNEASRFANARDLTRSGVLQRIQEFPGEVFVPSSAVLVAHALVHGLAQHGFAPQSYPMTRMLADLIDLGVGADGGRDLWRQATQFTAAHVRAEEARAVWDSCAALRRGERLADILGPHGTPAEVLLAHTVAGALDSTYRDALKLRALGSGPSRLPRPLAWSRDVARSLWPTGAQLRAQAKSCVAAHGAIGQRVRRPLVLAGRALHSAWSLLRTRRMTAVESSPRTR